MTNNTSSSGGYHRLNVFAYASILQLETSRFCSRFMNQQTDTLGQLSEQMTQAARSARAKIMEGHERSWASKEAELKYYAAARTDLSSLIGNYEMWILSKNEAPWKKDSMEAQAIQAWSLEEHGPWVDPLHDFGVYLLAQQASFQTLTNGSEVAAANALYLLGKRTLNMLSRIIDKKKEQFYGTGHSAPSPAPSQTPSPSQPPTNAEAPLCPQCGKPMRKVFAKRGPSAGQPFWSCTGYPECKGSRKIIAPTTAIASAPATASAPAPATAIA